VAWAWPTTPRAVAPICRGPAPDRGRSCRPTTPPPLEEPLVAVDQILEYTEPALLADGDGYLLFVTREPADAPVGDTAIWRAELPALDALTAAPALTQVLVADQAWEGGRVGAPALVDLGDRLVLFYAGVDAIGRAESTDRGRTWTKGAAPVVTGATSPGVAFDGRALAPGLRRRRRRDRPGQLRRRP
jgi:hypothetical protein